MYKFTNELACLFCECQEQALSSAGLLDSSPYKTRVVTSDLMLSKESEDNVVLQVYFFPWREACIF